MLCAAARLGVYPFGEKSMLTVDMNSEYIDYFMQLNKIFRERGSLLRSQDMGMGLNMLGLIAFYAASPLNILLMLSPADMLTETVLLLTIVKIGLSGLFFSIFAGYAFKRNDFISLGCSVGYALMGYNLAYSSNIMWLDGAALLPLVIMGVEKILREDKYLHFIVSLVFLFWCSYYIGYMAGCFAFLYFTFRFFSKKAPMRDYFGKLWRFIGSAALAAGCCAALLLPALQALRSGQQQLMSLPKSALTSFTPIVRLASKLVPGVYDSLTDSGLPNIYVSNAIVLLALLFYLNKRIKLRERLVFALFCGVMTLSLSWELPDLAWHAFEVPTWFPARYSFTVSFLIVCLALRCLSRPDGLTPPRVLAGAAIWCVLLFEIAVGGYTFVRTRSVLLAAFLTVSSCVVILAFTKGVTRKAGRALAIICVCLICAECFYNADAQLQGIERQFGYRTRDEYYSYRRQYLPAVELVERQYPGARRLEVLEPRNANGGMALGYNGVSHYSTTTDQALNTLLRKLGYNTGTINEVRFAKNNPLTNGLLGVRYLLGKHPPGNGYEYVDKIGAVSVFENPAAFPLAFFAGSEALEVDTAVTSPFALQNALISALTEEQELAPFVALEPVDESAENLIKSSRIPQAHYFYRPLTDIPGTLSFTLHNPRQLESYAFFPVYDRNFAKASAYSDSARLGQELSYRNNTVLALGSDEYPSVRLEVDSDRVYIEQMLFYGLDMEQAERAAEIAREREMLFTRFDDTRIDGRITAPHDGILATTLPYDSGWTVWVGGKKAPLKRLAGVFLAVELPAGQHDVSMRYSPPGFIAGVIISAISTISIILYQIRRKKKHD